MVLGSSPGRPIPLSKLEIELTAAVSNGIIIEALASHVVAVHLDESAAFGFEKVAGVHGCDFDAFMVILL